MTLDYTGEGKHQSYKNTEMTALSKMAASSNLINSLHISLIYNKVTEHTAYKEMQSWTPF